jgi:hypothetical protein
VVVRRTLVAALTAGSLAVVTVGGSVALAQQGEDAPSGSDDIALLERLDALEPELPADPPPTSVELDDDFDEDDEPWGQLDGDVTTASATLVTLQPQLLSLYVDSDAADTPVADAVADVARGWLDLAEGYDQLSAWESNDLALPIDASDDDGVATDADELRGRAEAGLRLVLGGRQRHLAGYVSLRELGLAGPDEQARLDARAEEAETFDRELRPLLHRLLSLRTTEVVIPVERFQTEAPGVEARARSMRITCVDREAYLDATAERNAEVGATAPDAASAPDAAPEAATDPAAAAPPPPDATTEDATAAEDTLAELGPEVDRLDCPDLPDELRTEER